mmetsp:Transcript_12374/g.24547  ORF Transcript_12374/g.24547 Transcript_12374/m.24547 type:complete len:203 (-) Transcript_12374:1624-2232(-)
MIFILFLGSARTPFLVLKDPLQLSDERLKLFLAQAAPFAAFHLQPLDGDLVLGDFPAVDGGLHLVPGHEGFKGHSAILAEGDEVVDHGELPRVFHDAVAAAVAFLVARPKGIELGGFWQVGLVVSRLHDVFLVVVLEGIGVGPGRFLREQQAASCELALGGHRRVRAVLRSKGVVGRATTGQGGLRRGDGLDRQRRHLGVAG